jgi:hypothetical protein
LKDDTFSLEASLLENLMKQIATLASVYHKPPDAFVMRAAPANQLTEDGDEEDVVEEVYDDEDEAEATGACILQFFKYRNVHHRCCDRSYCFCWRRWNGSS